MQDRKKKRRRLSAARHGAREHVASLERGWDGIELDGCRADEAELADASEKIGVELKRAEGHEMWCGGGPQRNPVTPATAGTTEVLGALKRTPLRPREPTAGRPNAQSRVIGTLETRQPLDSIVAHTLRASLGLRAGHPSRGTTCDPSLI